MTEVSVPTWSLITVTYNNAAALSEFWPTGPPLDVEWIVVDNASTDDTVDIAKSLGASIIELPSNVGFSRANNVGYQASKGVYIAFVNPDVTVDYSSLSRLAHEIDRLKGIVAPQLESPDGSLQPNGRGVPSLAFKIKNRLQRNEGRSRYRIIPENDETKYVAWMIGAALASRREYLDQLSGPWNEKFFLYYEDSDLGLRAWAKGIPCAVAGSIRWTHGWARATSHLRWQPWKREIASMFRFYRSYPSLAFSTLLPRKLRSASTKWGNPTQREANQELESVLVDLVVRMDSLTKSGGDFVQATAYSEELSRLGMDVRIVPFSLSFVPRPGSVVHAFNLRQIFDLTELLRSLSPSQRFFLSPIYQSADHLRGLRVAQRRNSRKEAILNLFPEVLRVYLSFAIRVRGLDDSTLLQKLAAILRATSRLPWIRISYREILNRAEAVFFLSKKEQRALIRDVGWRGRTGVLTPNGVPDRLRNTYDESYERESRVICVGRIESGKRSLETAIAARNAGLPVTFVGGANANEKAYVEAFKSVIADTAFLDWAGPIPHDAVLELMKSSRVLLNCSHLEVQSLVDLEAAFCGCHVVTVENGGASAEWLKERVHELPSGSVNEAVNLARELVDSGEKPPRPDYPHTWATTTRIIASSYENNQESVVS